MEARDKGTVQKMNIWIVDRFWHLFGERRVQITQTQTSWKISAFGLRHSGERKRLVIDIPKGEDDERA